MKAKQNGVAMFTFIYAKLYRLKSGHYRLAIVFELSE